jgi:hypothetical protein
VYFDCYNVVGCNSERTSSWEDQISVSITNSVYAAPYGTIWISRIFYIPPAVFYFGNNFIKNKKELPQNYINGPWFNSFCFYLEVPDAETIQERNLSGRDIIWRQIIPLIKSNAIFGVGSVGYNSYAQNVFGYIRSPHNVILELLCYTGIVGLALYSRFLLLICKKSLQIYRIKNLLLPILLLVPISGMLATSQILGVKMGWIIFAYIGAYSLEIQSTTQ